MTPYRFYFLNERGLILRGEDHSAADDKAACDIALQLDHTFDVEIWHLARMVDRVWPLKAKLKHFGPAAAA